MVRSLADRTFQLRLVRLVVLLLVGGLVRERERLGPDVAPLRLDVGQLLPMLALTRLSNYLTLKGSFSAVSKPTFASKYALESSRRDLHNTLICTVL